MTHKLLVAISKEAVKRGYTTTLAYEHDAWWLEISRTDKGTMDISHDTKIRNIERWMEETK